MLCPNSKQVMSVSWSLCRIKQDDLTEPQSNLCQAACDVALLVFSQRYSSMKSKGKECKRPATFASLAYINVAFPNMALANLKFHSVVVADLAFTNLAFANLAMLT